MISVRENVFESNSSSLHALTVPVDIEDNDYVKKNIKKEWYQNDGSIKIEVKLDDDLLDEGSFTIRHYIPHYSLNDKLMYLYATIIQHYKGRIVSGPYKPYRYTWEKDNSAYEKRMDEWKSEMEEFRLKSVHDSNTREIELFERDIHNLEERLAWEIRKAVFGEAPKDYYFDDEGNYRRKDPKDIEPDTRPEVKIHFEYFIGEDETIHFSKDPGDWFSTGCYGNEEFYYSFQNSEWYMVNWLLNPYAAILAGGDEQDDEDYIAQKKEAKRLLDESWKKFVEIHKNDPEYEEEDDPDVVSWGPKENKHLILNTGKVIFPIGG